LSSDTSSDPQTTFFNNNKDTESYDWRSTKPQRDMIYDTAGKMSKKEASLWYKLGRAIIENRPSESNRHEGESNKQ